MIVNAGRFRHETRLGTLTLDRRLDDHQLETVCRALEHAGAVPGDIISAIITEAGVAFRTVTGAVIER